LKLAIEIDGESHFREGAQQHDQDRQRFIEQFGIRFLRFLTTEVHQNLDGVMLRICETIEELKKDRSW